MGFDIHTACERHNGRQWIEVQLAKDAFDWRSYGLFGFLADVRNYSFVPPLAPQRGVPNDTSAEIQRFMEGYHSCSWLLLKELLEFDYSKTFEDRRTTVKIGERAWSGAGDAGEGKGRIVTFREFLGEGYFIELERLKAAGVERIVFGFDS